MKHCWICYSSSVEDDDKYRCDTCNNHYCEDCSYTFTQYYQHQGSRCYQCSNQRRLTPLLKSTIRDNKIKLALPTPIKDMFPINNNYVTKQVLTIDGKIPSVGDTFFYKSKSSSSITKGFVKDFNKISIESMNGVSYKNDEITLKTLSEMRDEKINKIFSNEN